MTAVGPRAGGGAAEGTAREATDLVCPDCREALCRDGDLLRCAACGAAFPVDGGIADFSGGSYYDDFPGPESLTPEHLQGLRHEEAGARSRIEDFYLPLISPRRGSAPLRVLDSGCGNGLSVDLLNEAGCRAWGNDVSRLRKWQWRERASRHRLVVADSRKLPFADGSFDAVLSSGVLEHVGVEEEGGGAYRVRPLPGRDAERRAFLAELLRLLGPGGELYLDFPNGAFPIDFWHGTKPGGARFHRRSEGFLPTVKEVRGHLRALGDYRLAAISPHRRLRMRQVGRHWYGRWLRWPMTALLRLSTFPPFRFLAASPLNPYLVLRVRRSSC